MASVSAAISEALLQDAGSHHARGERDDLRRLLSLLFGFCIGALLCMMSGLIGQRDASAINLVYRGLGFHGIERLAFTRPRSHWSSRSVPHPRVVAAGQPMDLTTPGWLFQSGHLFRDLLPASTDTRMSIRRKAWSAWELPFEAGSLSESVTTNSGVKMPRTIYSVPAREVCMRREVEPTDLAMSAIRNGYWGLQTSGHPLKDWEPGLAQALGLLSLERDDNFREKLFIQTWVDLDRASDISPGEPVSKQVETSIKLLLHDLRLDYVDSLILRDPLDDHMQTMEAWRAMERAVQAGLVRQIGINNPGSLMQMRRIYRDADVKPAVIQERYYKDKRNHRDMYAWAAEKGIYVQKFSRFDRFSESIPLFNATMERLAEKYYTTPEALFMRHMMGLGIGPLAGSIGDEDNMDELKACVIPLTQEDAQSIDDLLQQENPMLRLTPEATANEFNHWAEVGRAEANAEEHRADTLLLLDRLDIEGKFVVDIGCGNGWLLREMIQRGAAEGLGIDISPKMCERAQESIQFPFQEQYYCNNGEETSFASNLFDIVTCIESLYYFPDPEKAFAEWYRLARPGAQLAIMMDKAWMDALDIPPQFPSNAQMRESLQKVGWLNISMFTVWHGGPPKSKEDFQLAKDWPSYEQYLAYREIGSLCITATKATKEEAEALAHGVDAW